LAEAPPHLDRLLGMLVYASTTPGIGGRIKARLEDFIVEELAGPGRLMEGERDGRYALLLVEKRDLDTIKAAYRLARLLNVRVRDVTYAGLKDSFAVALQRFSVRGVSPEGLEGLSAPGVRIVAARRFNRPLSIGDLYGNRFTITVREVRLRPSEALSRVRATISWLMRRGGAPNFYGYQRFGTRRPNTHLVGRLIAKGDYEGAVREYLFKAYPGESERARRAREAGDYREALKLMPRRLVYERRMLRYLVNHPNDYVGALKTLPRPLLRLLIEAFQAYIFNKALSLRIMEMPDGYHMPMEGDVLLVPGERPFMVRRPEEAARMVEERGAIPAMPLASPKIRDHVHPLLARALEGEGIELAELTEERLLGVKLLPGLRGVVSRIRGFTVLRACEEGGSTTMTFRFTLERGCYATSVLREVMKPIDPLASGF